MDFSFVVPWRFHPERKAIYEWGSARLQRLFPTAPILFSDGGEETFDRGTAINRGVAKAITKYIFVVDLDTVFNHTEIGLALCAMDDGAPWVFPFESYLRLHRSTTTKVLREPPVVILPTLDIYDGGADVFTVLENSPYDPPESGLVGFRRHDFMEMGGFPEQFRGWGYEDRAFRLLMDRLMGPHQRTRGTIYHLWHPEPRSTTWDQPHLQANRHLYESMLTMTDDELRALNA